MSEIELQVNECSYPIETKVLPIETSEIPELVNILGGGTVLATCPFLNIEVPFEVRIKNGVPYFAACKASKEVCVYNQSGCRK